ncbi:hypothetical protein [Archangium lansingense]|uniref:Uncharacterized protein n=1 Tax=Archangium lansingense TaxID=2995310 RepID=A0ABT4A566_9BACT|nr:hypothetical protein [Archangium lansinium]MCY1076788.1 hypothetical protein [Archangium lansinium]
MTTGMVTGTTITTTGTTMAMTTTGTIMTTGMVMTMTTTTGTSKALRRWRSTRRTRRCT